MKPCGGCFPLRVVRAGRPGLTVGVRVPRRKHVLPAGCGRGPGCNYVKSPERYAPFRSSQARSWLPPRDALPFTNQTAMIVAAIAVSDYSCLRLLRINSAAFGQLDLRPPRT